MEEGRKILNNWKSIVINNIIDNENEKWKWNPENNGLKMKNKSSGSVAAYYLKILPIDKSNQSS